MKSIYKKHPWKIIESNYSASQNQLSESIFSIGNGRMGQRANFPEDYSGETLRGSYIAGIYYPDKTKVGWWKIGYPEYFAKVLNSVNWIGLHLKINGEKVDLAKVKVINFHRELDMQTGILKRECEIRVDKKTSLLISTERFYHLINKDLCFLRYKVENKGKKCEIEVTSYLDSDAWNEDTNYDESFWEFQKSKNKDNLYWVESTTRKTEFTVLAAQNTVATKNGTTLKSSKYKDSKQKIGQTFQTTLKEGDALTLDKYTAICSTFYYDRKELRSTAAKQVKKAQKAGFSSYKKSQSETWKKKWDSMDVKIDGDTSAQQGIRYNIFQLHQTYTGDDTRLNIGPKGFTGEKYGGSTYWDTEAYCLPFYMGTTDQKVSRSLLKYRHNHLQKAIENAEKLGFNKGAALYPMVTMNGEECHNEWEITFEEIHRNGAIAYAIYDYTRYYGDDGYIADYGIDVLTGIARFWAQRVSWSEQKSKYVILGVTGPNEYENNVNNNWYTNYIAKWCLNYAKSSYEQLMSSKQLKASDLSKRIKLSKKEVEKWGEIAEQIYLPRSSKHGIYLQQDDFLDKEQKLVDDINPNERPINQNWSWDRILRSPFIKQADVLQGIYFFEENFTEAALKKNFDYYEPRTVHESSLSPCVHSILAASLGREDKAYEMYLRTARLDLDNYNNDTEDGLHITSMAGSWLSVIKGFAGMRIKNDILSFKPFLPSKWKGFSFKLLHRGQAIQVTIDQNGILLNNQSDQTKEVRVFNRIYKIPAQSSKTINQL